VTSYKQLQAYVLFKHPFTSVYHICQLGHTGCLNKLSPSVVWLQETNSTTSIGRSFTKNKCHATRTFSNKISPEMNVRIEVQQEVRMRQSSTKKKWGIWRKAI